MSSPSRHLAHFNWGTLRGDFGSPEVAGFETAVDRVNALAERSPGFVWRSGEERELGLAVGWPLFADNPRCIASFSVWESADALREFVYKTVHGAFLRRREEWFEPASGPNAVLWWVQPGAIPGIEEARAGGVVSFRWRVRPCFQFCRYRGQTMKHLCAIALVCMGASVSAETLRPAPEYFVDAMMSITTAENIATACPNLTFDAVRASDVTTEVMEQLSADGFDAKNLEGAMEDPGDAVRARQAAFREKHMLSKDETDFIRICMAGFAEIKERTQVGSFLAEITGAGAVDPTKSDGAN